ncbi:YceD family protein [Ramlibacter sp. H39-3-26]|uniref:YceD family protein n=1 Tax=Curvibacter soli TaxID=3031331 RepID=UPI0023DB3477|nr:YceD family protein [Ramlibacter sp. H39-3-26]MDF1484347.1 YceD family protein [Ramlibacter sp. H39-3-26]
MSRDFSPDSLDVVAFAHAAGRLADTDPLSKYERLAQETQAPQPDLGTFCVDWRAEGEWRPAPGGGATAWLHLQAHAELPLVCQRCLGPLLLPLSVDRLFRFVADEATADAEDEEAEEDLLVASRDFHLRALVEDELLMALPVVPRHAECPVDVKLSAADPGFEAAEAERPHPFAALQALKKGGRQE